MAEATDVQSGLQVYKRLVAYIRPHWTKFLISIGGYLMYAAAQPMFARLLQYIVDSLQTLNREGIYWVPVAFISIVIFRGIGSFLGSYFLAMVSYNIIHTLRCQIFDRYTVLPAAYFESSNSGHLISRITHNVNLVTSAATNAIKVVVREGLTLLGLLAYLMYMNWQLSIIFLTIAPVIGILVNYASKKFRAISKKIQVSMGDITHVASEMVTGHRMVRSFGGEEYEKSRFSAASRYNYRQLLKLMKTTAIHSPLLQFIVAIALSILIYLALLLMTEASAGEFVAYITAAGLIPRSLKQLSSANATIQKGIAAAESVFEVLDEAEEVDNGQHETSRVSGKLEFRKLNFAYDESESNVLQDISFTIEPAQTIALVGQSGSGKTTLASLIPRFYDYNDGKILLDDIDIQNYTLKNLRQQIALVTQHITLFNDTVEKNIAYGILSDSTREQVIAAATAANAMEFIDKLPNGLDTLIGENGVKLSGGQRQRLAIARALLKDAPLLILDEATSALDTESERKIQNALEKALSGRTTLIIAHRLSTIEKADRIVVMEKGKILEIGNHNELLVKGGYYAHLHSLQFHGKISAVG